MRVSTRFGAVILAASIQLSACNAPLPGNGGGGGNLNPIQQDQPGFLYVLQPEGVVLDEIVNQPFKWLVLEPSRTGDAEGEFTYDEIESIRIGGPCGGKTVLAYLSIGEAEDYRDYWNPNWVDDEGIPHEATAPAWLGPPNPDFGGNYKVRYWDSDWQALILGTAEGDGKTPLDRIIDAGFDGVYLDIIDAYEFWSSPEGESELTRAQARELMIAWVAHLCEYARATRGVTDFLVFPQNGSDIIRDDDDQLDAASETYFAAVDGIGIEDLFSDETETQTDEEVQYRLEQLAEFHARGKTVLVTDYILSEPLAPADNGDRVVDFYERALAQGFIPYAAFEDRDLDEVVVLPGETWSVSQPPTKCSESDD